MSRRPTFEPVGFALELEKSGNYAVDGDLMYHWTGTHWTAIEELEVERRAMRWIADGGHGAITAANARAACQTALRWLPKLPLLSCTQAVIPVRNGYLHFTDRNPILECHDKILGLRHVLACDYEPLAAEPTTFLQFIRRILPDDAIRGRVQEYLGYTLLPDARFQRAQIWLGGGANGKGTLANLAQALHHRTAAVQLDALDGFRMVGMIGASLIYCDEAPQRNINEQAMKSLIAGELVQIDRKYQDPLTVRINGKWLILANHIPSISDQSMGFWRRFDVVPFDVSIPERERDPLLARRIIETELPGVLNWVLEGLLRLLARGRFDDALPETMSRALAGARTETNSVRAWVHDAGVSLSAAEMIPKADVYAAYARWCRDNGMKDMASSRFWKQLEDVLGIVVEGREVTAAGRVRTCNVSVG